MRRLLLGALPFAVLAAMLALRAWDPLPLQQLRWFAFDQYQRLAPRAYDPATPVRIVDIDDASLARIGQWPWPRTQLAKLLERLTQAGAAAIAFDMVFAERDRSSPEQVLKQWAPTLEMATLRDSFALMPSHDSMLAAAMGQAPVVTGFALTHERAGSSRAGAGAPASADGIPRSLLAAVPAEAPVDGEAGDAPRARAPTPKATFAVAGDDPALFVRAFKGAVTNLAELEAVALGNGAINSTPDLDQVIRRVPLVLALQGELYPSLAAEALRVAQGAATNVIKSSGASGVLAFGEQTGVSALRIGEFEIPTDPEGRLWLYSSRHEPAPLPFRLERARGRLRPGCRRRSDRAGGHQRGRPARHPRHAGGAVDPGRRDPCPGDRADPGRRFPPPAGLRRRHGARVHAGARPDHDHHAAHRSARWSACWSSGSRPSWCSPAPG